MFQDKAGNLYAFGSVKDAVVFVVKNAVTVPSIAALLRVRPCLLLRLHYLGYRLRQPFTYSLAYFVYGGLIIIHHSNGYGIVYAIVYPASHGVGMDRDKQVIACRLPSLGA